MKQTSRWIAAAVGILGLLCDAAGARAQATQAVERSASLADGTIQGVVQDDTGAPIAGAVVSVLGASTAVAVTDRVGRFELRTLSPGPYLLRAHSAGFVAARGQVVQVLPSARVSSSISLRRVVSGTAADPPVVAASLGGASTSAAPTAADAPPGAQPDAAVSPDGNDDAREETAWRLRHARRSILNEALEGAALIASASAPAPSGFDAESIFGKAVGSPARAATSFFADTPFAGQINLLTSGSFDVPQELFTTRSFERSTANVSVGAPVGEHADWTVHGAMTQGDISSWIVSGDYATRAPARHQYDVGLSYSAQRYDGANLAALRTVTDGSRNAGVMHGFDTFAISPAVSLTYGARYARYDYLDERSLLSPRVALTIVPADRFRINALVSRRALAPGAEEFAPPPTGSLWLPPQRTFSSLRDDRPLTAERSTDVEAEVERDVGPGTTVSVRAFRQQVDAQLVTLFGVDLPGRPATSVGHYFVADTGGANTTGYSTAIRTVIADRIRGSIAYTDARARWMPTSDLSYLVMVAPSVARTGTERVRDVAASLEADVPETSTRVIVLYRVSNGFARRDPGDRPALDSRFDVQIRQSLPFMDFSTARWEMLVAVRDFFRDASSEQVLFDELLVVRPPKRVVGGLTLRF